MRFAPQDALTASIQQSAFIVLPASSSGLTVSVTQRVKSVSEKILQVWFVNLALMDALLARLWPTFVQVAVQDTS